MTSATTPSKPAPQNPHQPTPAHQRTQSNAASPPSKRDLKSWWKRFQNQNKHNDVPETRPQGIFGVPLRQSITYANVAISLVDDDGKSFIYGYVPIVVAKCGVFLKEKATGIEGIFRLSGSEKRIKELKLQFDSPEKYGKGLVWDGYTVHDAANVLRRYLNDLPEPVVPLDLYEKFRDPLRGNTKPAVGDIEGTQLVENFDENKAIVEYQQLITELPPLNKQLLLYILDLLAVFAAKADENRMTAQNLAAIFQPGMLSHPGHAMAPEEYRLNQCVIIFLIENQDHFLIGMPGTAADEKTKLAIEKGTPPVLSPSTPSRKSGVTRSASNASAGAESVSRDGKIRRNRSTSSRHSRHSRHSNGTSTPNSPALVTTVSGGLARSNTVPSKKSPNIASGRFQRHDVPGIGVAPASPSPMSIAVATPPTVKEESTIAERKSPNSSMLAPGNGGHGRSSDRLLEPTLEAATPAKERNLGTLFQRSPNSDTEKRQPNKLRKKRIVSGANHSAHSSTASLTHPGAISPALEATSVAERGTQLEPTVPEHARLPNIPSESAPRAAQAPSSSSGVLQATPSPEDTKTLKPQTSPPGSLNSSYNDGSDLDQKDDIFYSQAGDQSDKERKRRWRVSRKKEDFAAPSSTQNLGTNSHAEGSNSSIVSSGYGHRPRKSWTGDSSELVATQAESEAGSRDARDEVRGPLGWIKNKYREVKDDHKRTKSPPDDQLHGFLPTRNKSVDLNRSTENKRATSPTQSPQEVPLPMSPTSVAPTREDKSRAS